MNFHADNFVQQERARHKLKVLGAECERCPLSKHGMPGRPVETEWFGAGSPSVAIVGEAPGRREVQLQRPFVGPSGKLLDYACSKGGIKRGEIAILNAAACGPIPSAADSMKRDAVAACRPRLLAELAQLQPKVILAVGSWALRALSPEGAAGITMLRGALLPLASDVMAQPHHRGIEIGRPIAGILPPLTHAPAVVGLAPPLAPRPYFLGTFHPAHILRGGDGEQDAPGGDSGPAVDLLFYFFLYDLTKAHRLAHGLARPWEDDLDLFMWRGRLVRPTFDDAGKPLAVEDVQPSTFVEAIERVESEAREHGEYASDVETDSKDAIRATLTASAVATLSGGLSATWEAWCRVPAALDVLRRMYADKQLLNVWHNKIYDTIVLPRHNLPVNLSRSHCTLLMHHAAFPGLPHKLDSVSTQFFVTAPWKAEFRRSEKDESSLILYNGRDALATARLRPALTKMLEAHKTTRVYEADRQQFAVATYMRKVGYFVDRAEQARQSAVQHARLEYMREALARDFKTIEETWRQALARLLAQKQRKKDPDSYLERVKLRYDGIADRDTKPTDIGLFKPKAKNDVVALFEVLRIPITDYTKTGAPVTDKKAMETASARHPLMRRLIHLREAQHVLATYIDGLPVQPDGRVHPDWSPKITGRWGAGKAQNWPKYVAGWPPEAHPDGSYKTKPSGDLVTPRENPRRIVTAPTIAEVLALPIMHVDPTIRLRAFSGFGRMLVGADFSQLELRIAGYLARDEYILDIFRRRTDPHATFARDCFGSKFTEAEEEFYALCKAAGVTAKIKEDLAKRTDLDAALVAQLIKPAAVWSRLRDLTKRAEYCGIYGGSAETVYESIVKDFPEVKLSALQALIDKINDRMAGVVRWRNEQETYARVNRETREQLLGRVRLFPLGNFNPNVVYNFPIQAFAASLLAKGFFRFTALTHPELLQIDELYRNGLLDARWVMEKRALGFGEWHAPVDPLLNGHDSILAEADDEDADRATECLEFSMHQTLTLPDGEEVDFPAEAAKGRRWSDT